MSQTVTPITEQQLVAAAESLGALKAEIERRVFGQSDLVLQAIVGLLARGNILIEGQPGLGKTLLVKVLSEALAMQFSRIQFTPDLMPADITGSQTLAHDEHGRAQLQFRAGPIFANMVLADEVNRATPKTQSALLEAMQEHSVTVAGQKRDLPSPFIVAATQNPIEMEGTYPLPEAQLDRFLCKIEVAAPDEGELVAILEETTGEGREAPRAVLDAQRIRAMRALARQVPASSDVLRTAARIVLRTDPAREDSPEPIRRHLRYGASPRGGQALLLLSKARALLRGHPWVSEEDLAAVAAPALRHRVVYSYEGEASGVHPDELVGAAVAAAIG